MRKLLVLLRMLIVLVMATPSLVWATAGACTQHTDVLGNGSVKVGFVCTGSSLDGSIPTQTFDSTAMKEVKGIYLYQVVVKPLAGGTAPDAATLVVNMEGQDVLGGKGANIIHATATQDTLPYSTFMSSYRYPIITDTITFAVTGQDTHSAQYVIDYIFVR